MRWVEVFEYFMVMNVLKSKATFLQLLEMLEGRCVVS